MNARSEDSPTLLARRRRSALIQLLPVLAAIAILGTTGRTFPFPRPDGGIGDEATFFWWLNTSALALLALYFAFAGWEAARLSLRLRRANDARRAAVRALLDRLRREGHSVSPTLKEYLLDRFDPEDLRRLPVRDWAAFLGGMESIAVARTKLRV